MWQIDERRPSYITVQVREYDFRRRAFVVVPVTIAVHYIIAMEWRWGQLAPNKEGKEFYVDVLTPALTSEEGFGSWSKTYCVVGEDARALYRMYTGQDAPQQPQEEECEEAQDEQDRARRKAEAWRADVHRDDIPF